MVIPCSDNSNLKIQNLFSKLKSAHFGYQVIQCLFKMYNTRKRKCDKYLNLLRTVH